MDTTQASVPVSRPSFAKVAASASKEDASSSTRRPAGSGHQQHIDDPTKSATVSTGPSQCPLATADQLAGQHAAHIDTAELSRTGDTDAVVDGLKDLQLGARTPSLVVNGSGSNITDRSKSVNRDGSDESLRADSNSELETKPPSLDGKSITSGTTFALDEKESLRPDDSASVKAASAEDDDAFSFRGHLPPNSRMSSDLAARARGIQLGDMPDRRVPNFATGSMSQGVGTPQSFSSDQQQGPAPNMAKITDLSNYMNALHGQTPDEKLLEAMSSQKDRLFLLRLEAELIKFVQNSKEPFMDFPPTNSFCRMLTHKLADYYHMTHQYEPRIGSVRIFRTPYARVPDSLASIGTPEPKSETPAPVVIPRKIMRRGEDGDPSTASGSPSKAASEAGIDGKDKSTPANQKLTREEKEEAYKQARERIFGSADKTGESTPDHEGESGMSRASSVSGRDRSNAAKRGKGNKHRRDESDSLDSRHLYGPFGPQQSWVSQTPYGPVPGSQYPMPLQQPYGGQMQPVYAQSGQPYPGHMQPSFAQYSPNMPAYAQQAQPQVTQPQTPQRPQMTSSPSMGAYGQPVPATAAQTAWQQGYSPSSATAPMPAPGPGAAPFTPRGVSAPPSQPTVPYAYGQLPAHINPHDPKSQHPIPGSYNRHAFNPKTQSFVPGGSIGSVQQPQPSFSAPGSHHNSPQIGSPHLAYAGGYPPAGPAAAATYGGPPGYGMARQGSNTSIPQYQPGPPQHAPALPPVQHGSPYMPQQPHPQPQAFTQNPSAYIPNKPPAPPQGPAGQTFHHLPQYGNPATLPQKPNTGI